MTAGVNHMDADVRVELVGPGGDPEAVAVLMPDLRQELCSSMSSRFPRFQSGQPHREARALTWPPRPPSTSR